MSPYRVLRLQGAPLTFFSTVEAGEKEESDYLEVGQYLFYRSVKSCTRATLHEWR